MSANISSTISTYFQRILFRDPAASELNSWSALVDSGTLTFDQVRASLVTSSEASNFVDPVIRLYQSAFGRVPESDAALNFYADNLRAGTWTITDIAKNFAASPEFALRYGENGPTAAYITSLYLNVLGRAPVAAEVDWYLASGMTTAQMLQGFSQSPEFQTRSGAAVDALLDSNALGTAVFAGPLQIGATGPTFELTAGADSVDEGDVVLFTLRTTNVSAGAAFDYVIGGVSAPDVVGGQLSGRAIIGNDGMAVISVRLAADRTTEVTAETLTLSVAGQTKAVAINDTSLSPTYVLNSSADAVNEGDTVVFTLQTTNVDANARFEYVIGGVSAGDVVGGALTGSATVGADGKAEIRVQMARDGLSEATETLTLTVAGQTQNVTVRDVAQSILLTQGLDDVQGGRGNDLIIGTNDPQTFNAGDVIDGGDGADTLLLDLTSKFEYVYLGPPNFTEVPGGWVSNVETVTIYATDGNLLYPSPVVLRMNRFDDSVEQINILDAETDVSVLDQQSLANVTIRDTNQDIVLDYDQQAVAGDNDALSLTIDEVGHADNTPILFSALPGVFSNITIGDGVEGLSLHVADGVNEGSNVDIDALDLGVVTVTGGIVGQDVGIGLDIAGGATFVSTAFAGDVQLYSGDVRIARMGAGNDELHISGWADNTDALYALGAGDNELTISSVVLAGAVTAADGDNTIDLVTVAPTGSVTLGDGDNHVDVADNVLGTIIVGDGDNEVHVEDDVGRSAVGEDAAIAATLTFGEGDNDVTVGEDIEGGSTLTFGDGTNTLDVASDISDASTTVTFGDGDNDVTVREDIQSGAAVRFGDGDNEVSVTGDIRAATLSFGEGDNEVSVVDRIEQGSTLNFGEGDNTLNIGNDLDGSTLNFGGGDNIVTIIDEFQGGSTATFGDGDNTVAIGDDLELGSTLRFGDGDNTVSIEDDIDDASTLSFGDGDNTVLVEQDIESGSTVTFGLGADSFTLGSVDGDGRPDEVTSISGLDAVQTTVDMGGGDDEALLRTTGAAVVPVGIGPASPPPPPAIVQSGAVVDGGEGDDVMTLRAADSVDLVRRTQAQVVELDLTNLDATGYTVGQVVEASFTRGEESFTVSYTVLASDIVQSNGALTSANVAAGLTTALNADAEFTALFGTARSDAVITLTSDLPQLDFTITATAGTVTVEDISDARIRDFETLNLVALDNQDGPVSMTIGADFDLIDNTSTINLDSQVQRVEVVNNATWEGAYSTYSGSGPTTFVLDNLKGGEAITVSGHEATARGNAQVARITVGDDNDSHRIGDKITVQIGEWEGSYTVVAADLVGGANSVADAGRIATKLQAMIDAASAEHGFTAQVDVLDAVPGGETSKVFVTLIGVPGAANVVMGAAHTRTDEGTLTIPPSTSWNVRDSLNLIAAGDVITVTKGANTYEYVVTAEDMDPHCGRTSAERISEALATEIGGDASAAWGVVTFGGTAGVVATRIVDVLVGSTLLTGSAVQASTATDDHAFDVVVKAELAAELDTANDTMALTVDGLGDFDLAIRPVGEDQGNYEHLELTVADAHSHYIDTYGDEGNFAESITLTGGTAGEAIYLDWVAAKDVSAVSPANITINQYGDHYNQDPHPEADPVYGLLSNADVITVETGSGNDHLLTLAPAALNNGSSIDLGTGENRLSLGWGTPAVLDSADLEQVGDIDYAGNLTQLDILNNVVLDQESTTLTMPGGVGGVETVTFTNVEADTDDVVENLTIAGVANDVRIESAGDFRLGYLEVVPDVSSFRVNAAQLGAGVTVVNGALASPSDLYYGSDIYKFTHTGGALTIGSDDQFSTNMFLLNGNGQVLLGTDNDDFTVNLAAGIYYVAIGANNIDAYALEADFENGGINKIWDNDWGVNDGSDEALATAVIDVIGWDAGPNGDSDEGLYTLTFSVATGGSTLSDGPTVYERDLVSGEFGTFVGVFTATNAAGEQITGDLTVEAGDDVRFNLGNNALASLTVEAGGEADVYVAGNEGAAFDIGALSLRTFDAGSPNLLVIENTDTTLTVGSVTLRTGDADGSEHDYGVTVSDNLRSDVNLGVVVLEGLFSDGIMYVARNNETSVTLASLDISTECEAVFIVEANLGSDITVEGAITLSAGAPGTDDAILEVIGNDETDVSLAASGTITMISCNENALLSIDDNSNHLLTNDGDDQDDHDHSILLGDVVLDAFLNAEAHIQGNLDDDSDGDLRIELGDLTMRAYNDAEIVVGVDSIGVAVADVNQDANISTTIVVDAVDARAQDNIRVAIAENQGNYWEGYSVRGGWRAEEDFARITFGDVSLDAGIDVAVEIGSNDLTVVALGTDAAESVHIAAGEDATVAITDNTDSSISLGDTVIEAGEDAGLTISGNSADPTEDEGQTLAEPEFGRTIVSLGDLEMTAGEDADFTIGGGNDTVVGNLGNIEIDVSVDSVTMEAVETAGLNVIGNDAISVTIAGDTSITGEDASFRADDNLGIELSAQDVDLTATDDADFALINNRFGSYALSDVTLSAGGTGGFDIVNNDGGTMLVGEFLRLGEALPADYDDIVIGDTAVVAVFYSEYLANTKTLDFPLWGGAYETSPPIDPLDPNLILLPYTLTSGIYSGREVYFLLGENGESQADATLLNIFATELGVDASELIALFDGLTYISDDLTIDMDSVTVNAAEEIDASINDNDNATITISGAVTLVSGTLPEPEAVSNDDVWAVLDIEGGADVTLNINNNDNSIVWVGYDTTRSTVTLQSGDTARFNIQFNDADGFDAEVQVGNVVAEAVEDVYFHISDNDGDDDNDVTVDIGTLTINAGDYADVHIDTEDDNQITVGDIVIDAGNDVNFDVEGLGEDADLTLGDIDIRAGLTQLGLDNGDVDFDRAYVDVDIVDVAGAEEVSVDATASLDSLMEVYVDDAWDMHTLTLSGSHADVYLAGDMGGQGPSENRFTLDLSGLTGSFGAGGADSHDWRFDYGVDGVSSGVWVETWNADFTGTSDTTGIVTVKIGSSDLVYNATHTDHQDDDLPSNMGEDWSYDEGWYSMGSGGDFTPSAQVQVITGFENAGSNQEDNDSDTFYNAIQFDQDSQSYRIQVSQYRSDSFNLSDGDDSVIYNNGMEFAKLVNGVWESRSEAQMVADLGIADISYSGGFYGTFVFTGAADGTAFLAIQDVQQVKYAQSGDAGVEGINEGIDSTPTDLLSSNQIGDLAEDNQGQIAREVFQFTGDTVGEVVIGGFNPGAWGQASPENGRPVDRLDWSQFDWNGEEEGNGSVDLSYFSFTIEDNDGYFKDVVVDFIGGDLLAASEVDFAEVRLVGVGEFDNAINLVKDSMFFG